MKKTIIVLGIPVLMACGGGQPPVAGVSDVEGVIKTLAAAAAENKILFGHQDDTAYGHDWNGEYGRSDIKEVCGDFPAVMGWDIGGVERGDEKNLDGIPFEYMSKLIVDQYERGGINTVSWHLFNPFTGGNSWDTSFGTVVASVLEGGELHGLFLDWLGCAADFLGSLKTADGRLVPVIFRPWHEHTGSWFWWGDDLCTPDQYKALWRMTVDFLRKERGLTNIIMSYSPNLGAGKDKYMEKYPGDEYVDMLGFDVYQFGGADGAREYMDGLEYSLDILTAIGEERGKPVALTETGCEGVPMERWWTDVLYASVRDYPVCYVLTWRNAWNRSEHFYAPYPGQLSAGNFREFYALPETVFLKDIINIKTEK